MERSKSGNFRLSDMMILVAATAAGLSLVQWNRALDWWPGLDPFDLRFLDMRIAIVACPLLLAWTVAALAIRLRSPRPSRRRLASQPGWVASLSVLICYPITCAVQSIWTLRSDGQRWAEQFSHRFTRELHLWSAYVVFGAWFALWLNRRWRPEPSAIDRLGRALGFGWIFLFLLNSMIMIANSIAH